MGQRALCPPDTIGYTIEKATNVDTFDFDPQTNQGVYQYFEAPQQISVTGARFYGFKRDTTGGNSVYITVELRKGTSDTIPSTNLLAVDSVLVSIPDSFDGPLEQYQHEVTWPAVSVDGPYTIVVRGHFNSGEFTLLHNHLDGANSDGDNEWLSGFYQSGWIKGRNFPGGEFDADFFIEPFVQYNLNASFINDPECLFDELGDTVHFFNDGSVIGDSRMYNRYAFYGVGTRQMWNYGDGTPTQAYPNAVHFYPTNGPYAATLTVKILTWTQQLCESSVTQIIKEKPEQDFSYTTDNLEVQFENETFGLFSDIQYDFGDGQSSTSEDPKHKYAEPGTYWVCQTMLTSCGEITKCKNVAVATNTALSCGKDSIRYTAARGTGTKSIRLNNPYSFGTQILGVGQRFDAPQSMIVHGFSFYANHEGLFKDSYPVTCRIWKRGGNNLPDTANGQSFLAESIVHINKHDVDTLYSDTTRYTAIFDRPVNLMEDYILTIEYDSNVPVNIMTNDWEAGDGDADLLIVGKIADSTWVTAASLGSFKCGGMACDCDVLIEPLVEYNMDANFEYDFECLKFDENGQKTVQFTDLSSPIAKSPIYNSIAFYGSSVQAYEWDFGDSTGISNQVNAVHVFKAPGPFDVTLTTTIDGWTKDCESTQTLNVPVAPTGGFSYELETSAVTFVDSSHNADEYWWTFDDGTFSTLEAPVHYFTEIGTFEVCQYVSNVCGSDTTCDSITINVIGIPETYMEDLHIFPNPAQDYLNIQGELSSDMSVEIGLMDMSGRTVRSFRTESGVINNAWYVGDLSRGMYLMRIKIGDYEGSKRVVLGD